MAVTCGTTGRLRRRSGQDPADGTIDPPGEGSRIAADAISPDNGSELVQLLAGHLTPGICHLGEGRLPGRHFPGTGITPGPARLIMPDPSHTP
jgi:hypothetical protein